jgi:hypothetical protein
MVARWSANPLGMLWPEGDEQLALLQAELQRVRPALEAAGITLGQISRRRRAADR